MTSIDDQIAPSEVWHDRGLTAHDRASALLSQMTFPEKLQQLGSTWPGSENLEEAVAPLQDSHQLAAPFDEAIVDGIGHLTRPFGTAPIEPHDGMLRLADLQRQVVSANRFGIPAIVHEECLTGFTAWKATIYPTSLAWAATFDPGIVERMAQNIGRDMHAVGVHQGLSPVLDVVRDYRWGRVEETMGEDPYLVSQIAASYVTGLQSEGVIATLKHFVGYAASRGGRNHAPVSVGQRELRDVLLRPFEQAIVHAGACSVMNSYTDLDGVPAASDSALFTDLLRNEWGFAGTVVSDYWAVPFLLSMHRIVATNAEAGALALTAGIDVELPHTVGFTAEAAELAGRDVVDRAVLRVLTQKVELGLLDPDWAAAEAAWVSLDSDHNRLVARAVAEESVVLLHNPQGILPLQSPLRIAVIGPVANESASLFGCYAFPNHVLPNFPEAGLGLEAPTLLDAIRTEFPGAHVDFAPGVPVLEPDESGIADAEATARSADIVILAVGDRSGMFGHGTSGEGCDVTSLDLPGVQSVLVDRILATGTKVVLVTLSGRPYAIGGYVERSKAAVQAFLPGQEGAGAIAGVLSGRVNPSGRLPVQIPGDASAQPGTYLAPPLALRSDGVSNIDPTPAFPFGFGLSYSTMEISSTTVSAAVIATHGEVIVSAIVRNTGSRHAVAVPQLYMSDPVAEVTRPVRQLIGFTRVALEAGASSEIQFVVSSDLFAYTGRDLRRRIDPGEVLLLVAENAGDSREAAVVQLTGPTRFVDHTRTMSTTATSTVLAESL
ncbi:beta-glucosidase family protein [Subtercola frigoramans]|uniref:Beta-glucosidase n=1 Tax=Subtercola frigoramans TaxID=120298 RepID=A0ABS2L150_9MICO|nr:glycoside hydrolase family 3 N-terminal domain-containing protein [Subtercola frigoramans]MBM7470676.1 beta-glucosidase [Subtercola frigoramans]